LGVPSVYLGLALALLGVATLAAWIGAQLTLATVKRSSHQIHRKASARLIESLERLGESISACPAGIL
jgi:hypothetical protein